MNQTRAHDQLVAMARHNLAHVAAGTIDQTPDVVRVPAAHYVDPERFRLEVARTERLQGHDRRGRAGAALARQ